MQYCRRGQKSWHRNFELTHIQLFNKNIYRKTIELHATYDCSNCDWTCSMDILPFFIYRYNFSKKRGEVCLPPLIEHKCGQKLVRLAPKLDRLALPAAFMAMAKQIGTEFYGMGYRKANTKTTAQKKTGNQKPGIEKNSTVQSDEKSK